MTTFPSLSTWQTKMKIQDALAKLPGTRMLDDVYRTGAYTNLNATIRLIQDNLQQDYVAVFDHIGADIVVLVESLVPDLKLTQPIDEKVIRMYLREKATPLTGKELDVSAGQVEAE